MTSYRFGIALLALLLCNLAASAEQLVFEGPWHTTNRNLDGVMTCVVTPVADGQWQGRFYGVWQGVNFDYTVAFSGPPSSLRGTANIDGADYMWTGDITTSDVGLQTPARFKGTFGGSRYTGYFDLKEKKATR
jgi:hypothetical protein